MKKSNNISIIDKDGEQCLECRCLQLVWRMIQAGCSSMFILLLLLLLSHVSSVRLCAAPEMAAHQAPPSLGFSRQEHWSGLPFPYSGDLPDPGIELSSPTLQADYTV